ncbi:hypothetical protein EYC84_011464 [Monilinia fructicola]|uniref:Uncharacterized protein n=1 Tax=Monilinia fructicola TaxID=38448 RepID=A0A5M9J8E1_MONFR|nr:hypothetical protein EYC84_011464 [Monilinia fructicola]
MPEFSRQKTPSLLTSHKTTLSKTRISGQHTSLSGQERRHATKLLSNITQEHLYNILPTANSQASLGSGQDGRHATKAPTKRIISQILLEPSTSLPGHKYRRATKHNTTPQKRAPEYQNLT